MVISILVFHSTHFKKYDFVLMEYDRLFSSIYKVAQNKVECNLEDYYFITEDNTVLLVDLDAEQIIIKKKWSDLSYVDQSI